jgi:hypothetical protein
VCGLGAADVFLPSYQDWQTLVQKNRGPRQSRIRALLPGSTLGKIPEASRLVRRETRHESAGTNFNYNELSVWPTDQDPARRRRVVGFLSFEIVQAVNLEFDAVLVAEQTSWLLLDHTLTVFTTRGSASTLQRARRPCVGIQNIAPSWRAEIQRVKQGIWLPPKPDALPD